MFEWHRVTENGSKGSKSCKVMYHMTTVEKSAAMLVAVIILLLAIVVGRSLYEEFQGIEMIRSVDPNRRSNGPIVVRRFGEDQPRYLCKYYGSGSLISAQTYWTAPSSSPARTATVTWNNSGAIVYLDDTPVLEMSELGFWTEVKKR